MSDSDSYMRLIRVLELHQSGTFQDNISKSLSAPDGLQIHWTRVLDIILLIAAQLISILRGFDFEKSLIISGSFVSFSLYIVSVITIWWASAGVWSRGQSFLSIVLYFSSSLTAAYAKIGNSDHHILMQFLFAASLGFAIRALCPGARPVMAFAAGAAMGFGLWVNASMLMLAAPMIVAFGLSSLLLRNSKELAGAGSRFCLGATAVVVAAIMLEKPPSAWARVEYDRVSIVHLSALLVSLVMMRVLGRTVHWSGRSRFSFVSVCGAALMLILWLAFPAIPLGPLGDADLGFREIAAPLIPEMWPLPPLREGGLRETVAYLGGAWLAGVIALTLAAPRWSSRGMGAIALLLGSTLCVCIVGSFATRRLALELAVPAAIAGAGLIAELVRLPRPKCVELRHLLAGSVTAVILVTPVFINLPSVPTAMVEGCDDKAAIDWLAEVRPVWRPGEAAPIVMSSNFHIGPEIVWRSGYRAVASGYHRGGHALSDTVTVFGSRNMDEVYDILDRRGVDIIMTCDSVPNLSVHPGSLLWRMTARNVPVWLRPLSLPPQLEHYRIYIVSPRNML